MKKIQLESIIRGRTLPKTISYIIFCTLILMAGLLYFSFIQTELRHQSYLDRFVTHLESRIANIQSEVSNLAQNDLIINSVVDFEFQERALPIFISSLKLSVTEVDIGFTDYKGRLVTANNKQFDLNTLKFSDWKKTVLENGQPFFEFNKGELLIVEPVIYSTEAEAAMVVHVKDISSLVDGLPDGTSDIALIDHHNNILFSTDQAAFPLNMRLDTNSLSGLYTLKRPFLEWHAISSEKLWGSFVSLLPFFIFLILCVLGVIFSTLSGVRISAKQASRAVHDLQQTLFNSANSSIEEINVESNELCIDSRMSNILEFLDIQSQFSSLLRDLNETSLSRNTLSGVVNSLDEILLVLSFDNEIILKNRRLEKLLLDLDIILPLDIERLLPSSFLSGTIETEGIECTYSPNNFASLPHPIDLKWRRHLYRNAEGKHIGFTLSGNDITLEKSIEAELLIKNKAMDESNTSIIISESKDNSFPIIYVNRAFEELTGFKKESILDRECKFLQGPHSEQEKLAQIREALVKQEHICVTLTNYRKNGEPFQNQLTLSPIFDQSGKLTHYIGLQEDVSEREQANNLIKQAQIKAEESARLKSDFLASMSHEIRTPMNGILGMLNIIKDTELSLSQKEQLTLAEQSASSLLTIINDILDFSKIEAGKLHLDPTELDLYHEFDCVIQPLALSAITKGIRLVTDLSGIKSPYVIGDASRIKQIFTNLISNAIKFTDDGLVNIDISTVNNSDGKIILSVNVTDQGIGIDEKSLTKIFETFSQADASTTRKYGGTGLGLSISRQICRMMGGDISVKSEFGIGSTFSFNINLEASTKTFSPPSIYKEKKVFILDSSKAEAHCLQAQLKIWGDNIFLMESIEDLLSCLSESEPCVVFLDEDTLNTLDNKKFQTTKAVFNALQVSTFMISTNEFNAYINHSLFGNPSKHAINHLIKPISPKQLIDKISIQKAVGEIVKEDSPPQEDICTNRQILLVEDNHINQIVAKSILESLGAEVHLANHGIEAIRMLQNAPSFFDLILMDCQMPEMDGYEASTLIRQAQAGESYADTPIIALTANALKGDKEKCIQAGMNDHVSKPIDIQDLSEKIKLWLNSKDDTEELDITTRENTLSEQTSDFSDDKDSRPEDTGEDEIYAIWDEEEMLHRIGNNIPLAIQLVDVFCEDVDELFTSLKEAYSANDLEEVGSHAHSLKGVAGNISGHKSTALFAKLEKESKQKITRNLAGYISQAPAMIEELKTVMIEASKKWSA